jgi:hypothetical protein
MNGRLLTTAALAVAAMAAAAWFGRDTATMLALEHALHLRADPPARTTTETLHAAGVHKCRTSAGILYVDAACPKGSSEVKATGGTVTVMPFPRPAPTMPTFASGAPGGPLIKPMDPAERDRLRDKAIEDAADRR